MTKSSKIVDAYRKFYRAADPRDMNAAALPVSIAFDVLRDASRVLFDDRESIEEAIAGQIFQIVKQQGQDNDNADVYQNIFQFVSTFLDALPSQAISDAGFIHLPFREIIENSCAVLYLDAEKANEKSISVTDLAKQAGVRREYVLAEINRGNIDNAEKVGMSYVIPESAARKWLDNPKRGSRSKSE